MLTNFNPAENAYLHTPSDQAEARGDKRRNQQGARLSASPFN